MARPLRIQYPGAVYHVTCRGNERKDIFRDDTDRERFVSLLEQSAEIYSVTVYAYDVYAYDRSGVNSLLLTNEAR